MSAMDWPDNVGEDAKAATMKFFNGLPDDKIRNGLMLAFAYGYTEAHDEIRREAVLAKFKASVERLKVGEAP